MTNPAIKVETERLTLTALAPEHSDHLYSLLSDKAHTRYLSIPTTTCPKTVRQMTEGMLAHPGNCLWLITEKESQAFVGMCGFTNDSAVMNFIYSIAESQKGRGYVSEAAEAAIETGRRLLGIDQIELNIHSQNKASLRVAQKLGFQKVSEYKVSYPEDPEPVSVHVFRRTY